MTQEERPIESGDERRIPEFKSREEAGAWFDTHDLADYQDEFKTVPARFSRNLSKGLNIRLDKETLEAIRELAHEKGIGPTTLVRMWVLEHLRERKDKSA
jgi:predicted DNA binding CopG/RHH family protein